MTSKPLDTQGSSAHNEETEIVTSQVATQSDVEPLEIHTHAIPMGIPARSAGKVRDINLNIGSPTNLDHEWAHAIRIRDDNRGYDEALLRLTISALSARQAMIIKNLCVQRSTYKTLNIAWNILLFLSLAIQILNWAMSCTENSEVERPDDHDHVPNKSYCRLWEIGLIFAAICPILSLISFGLNILATKRLHLLAEIWSMVCLCLCFVMTVLTVTTYLIELETNTWLNIITLLWIVVICGFTIYVLVRGILILRLLIKINKIQRKIVDSSMSM